MLLVIRSLLVRRSLVRRSRSLRNIAIETAAFASISGLEIQRSFETTEDVLVDMLGDAWLCLPVSLRMKVHEANSAR